MNFTMPWSLFWADHDWIRLFGLIGERLQENRKANNIKCDSCDDENRPWLVWNIAAILTVLWFCIGWSWRRYVNWRLANEHCSASCIWCCRPCSNEYRSVATGACAVDLFVLRISCVASWLFVWLSLCAFACCFYAFLSYYYVSYGQRLHLHAFTNVLCDYWGICSMLIRVTVYLQLCVKYEYHPFCAFKFR